MSTKPHPILQFRAGLPLMLVALLVLPACAIVQHSDIVVTGHKTSSEEYAQITLGKTKQEVLTLLGPPTEKINQADGGELWKWHYQERRESSNGLILVIVSRNTTVIDTTTQVEFKDGTVTRVWQS